MTDRPRRGRHERVATLPALLVLSLLAGVFLGLATRNAAAQGFGWFGGLFGGGNTSQPQGPSYPGGYGAAPDNTYQPRRRPRRRPEQTQRSAPREAPAATAEKTPPQKKNATSFVYVFGDTLGQFLANGLDDALADRQDVAVVHKARGPSGLVTKDYFDWPKAIDTLLAGKDKIDVAVMMVGSNDRQPITEDGKSYDPGSDEWNAIYAKRVLAIDEAFRKKNIPLIWVGVPIAKNPDFADSMAALNDIYRDAAAKTGAIYVDTWEAFSDDNGDFAAFGPDINGQTVRLRSGDGILFTAAGARKLAHFVEAHVRRDLDGKAPPPVLPTAPGAQAGLTGGEPKPGEQKPGAPKPGVPKPAVVKPEAGPITSLTEAPSASGGELLAPASTGTTGEESAAERLVKGDAQAAPAGRADDLRWPPNGTKSP